MKRIALYVSASTQHAFRASLLRGAAIVSRTGGRLITAVGDVVPTSESGVACVASSLLMQRLRAGEFDAIVSSIEGETPAFIAAETRLRTY